MFMEMANRRRRRGGSVSPPAPTVEDILSGTAGFALDFRDTTRMWTTSAKATLVASASDPIGAMESKWGAAVAGFTQGTSGNRPIWNGGIAGDFDSASSHFLLGDAVARALLNNKPAGFGCGKFIFDTLATLQPAFSIAAAAATQPRFALYVNTDGSLSALVRVLDGAGTTTRSSTTGLVTTGVPYVFTMTCDYAGSGGIKVYLNGTEVISGALAVTPGNTSATDSTSWALGRYSTANYHNGRISRMVFGDKLFTSGEIATIEAWVGQGALS